MAIDVNGLMHLYQQNCVSMVIGARLRRVQSLKLNIPQLGMSSHPFSTPPKAPQTR